MKQMNYLKKYFIRNDGLMKRLLLLLGLTLIVCLGVFSFSEKVQAKTPYKIKGQKITVSAKNNTDITEELDAALKKARDTATSSKRMTVVVPKGTYKINEKGLHIWSNTTLDLSAGVTLKYSGRKSHYMLQTGINGKYKGYKNYNKSKACSGYNGFRNIKIIGGKWISKKTNTSTVMRLFHAKNVTLEKVTISQGGGVHLIEAAAIDGFYLKNCTFKDSGNESKKERKQEAIQLDIPCSSEVYAEVYQDGTVMRNIEISGCTFSNLFRGVGTHTLLNGAYFTNVKIKNNKFINIKEEAIVTLNYINCEIRNNTINKSGGGILVQFFKATPESITTTIFDGEKAYEGEIQHNANTVIRSNTINTKYYENCDEIQGIKVYGFNMTKSVKGRDGKKIPKGNYYISNVTVENNEITTAGHGIHMMDTRNSIVRNNTIIGSGVSSKDKNKARYDGILIENYAKDMYVTGNTIKNMPRNGIFVQENAYVSALENNKISNCKRSGINFYMKSGTKKDITKNSIKDCAANGILVSTQCNVTNIIGNTIALTDSNTGISVYDNSKVGKISGNTIRNYSSSGKIIDSGIKLTTKANVEEISNNKIISSNSANKVAGTGIMVYSDSKINGSVKDNEIGRVKGIGISITTNGRVAGSISSNTITNAGTKGVMIYKNSSVGKDINENVIKKCADGIFLSQGSVVTGYITQNDIIASNREYYIDKSCKTGGIK